MFRECVEFINDRDEDCGLFDRTMSAMCPALFSMGANIADEYLAKVELFHSHLCSLDDSAPMQEAAYITYKG